MLLAVSVAALLVYAFWPTLTGEDLDGAREMGEEVSDASTVIEVIVVKPSDFPLRAEAIGHMAPWRRAEISAEADGVILERPIEEGQRVRQGALLLRLDDRDEQIEFLDAEAAVFKARAEYAVNTSNSETLTPGDTTQLASARSALAQAEADFDAGTLTQSALRDIRRRFETQVALAGMQRSDIQAATYGLTQAEQQLERARLALSRTRITAPFAGRVADLEVEVGQRIGPGQKVLTLLEDHRMKVAVNVLEADIVHMSVGASAQVRVPVLDNAVFTGTIYAVNPSVDTKTGTGRVTVTLPNPRGQLVAGLYADIALETQRLEERLVVPANAWLLRNGRDLVFRVVEGKAYWTYVTIGERSGDFVDVLDGLTAGDTVAVQGHYALAHDTPVQIARVLEQEIH